MIVIKERDCAGLDPAALRQIMGIAAEEMLVIIKTLDDGTRIPPLEPEPEYQPTAGAISSLVVVEDLDVSTSPDGERGGSHVRLIPEGNTEPGAEKLTIPPANGDPLLPMDTKPHRLERGASWGEIQATAKAMRVTATMGAGSGVVLTDAFGSMVFPDVPAAVAALNARWAHFNAIGTR